MRILVMLGWANGYGGVENVVRLFSEYMSDHGHQVIIALDKTGVQSTRWLQGKQWTFINLGLKRGTTVWKVLRVVVCVWLLIRYQPDFVLVDIPYWLKFVRRARSLLGGRKRPLIASWVQTHIEPGSMWLPYADCHLALSQANYQQLVKISGPDRVRTVNNPVVLPKRLINRSQSVPSHFVYIGRLAPEKHVDLLLNAMSLLQDIDVQLTVVGDGPLRDELQSQAARLGLSRSTQWMGWMEDPWGTLPSVTALVLPSPREGFGLVVVEALAHGVPVVVSAENALRDLVIQQEAGWEFETGDYTDLANILRRIANGENALPEQPHLARLAQPYGLEAWGSMFEQALVELSENLAAHTLPQLT